jgi:hypothetical protein
MDGIAHLGEHVPRDLASGEIPEQPIRVVAAAIVDDRQCVA